MNPKKMAVIEDMDAFLAWLATTPFVSSASRKPEPAQTAKSAAPGPDADLLAALQSMA